AHRLAWWWVYGEWPTGEIDHINHDRSDNLCAFNIRDFTWISIYPSRFLPALIEPASLPGNLELYE
ncbi:HNH endonuclease, partial [Escherichia coli]|uniref:HNH endonuclease n=1 Tax=Escherichia coli TaxID=562 RepID=UPI001932FFD9